MRKVDFFIVGAQKTGTTSLYKYLDEHPDIFMPIVKENHFFIDDKAYQKGENYFHQFYDSYQSQKLIGGASVHMFSTLAVPERIYHYNKDAKIIIMLRNPVDRAYSAYNFAIKNGWEQPSNHFIDTIALQEQRIKGSFNEQTNLSYFYVGLYYQHISNWLKWFPKENIYIIFNNDLKKNAQKTVQDVCRFLGVVENVSINTDVVHNKSGAVRFKSIHFFIRSKDNKIKNTISNMLPFKIKYLLRTKVRKGLDKINMKEVDYKPLSNDERKIVFNYFDEDVKNLSALLNKDLYNQWKPV
ncbi:MAG: sulfotransferase domain-containing protein [Bacteroidetes bacterium]|nr:sulfotransferase domain-containing protein [Bacteroidota bacterium]